jgi:hypothetical protein
MKDIVLAEVDRLAAFRPAVADLAALYPSDRDQVGPHRLQAN